MNRRYVAMLYGAGPPSTESGQRWDAMIFPTRAEADDFVCRYVCRTSFESQAMLLSVTADGTVQLLSLWGPAVDLDPDYLAIFPNRPLSFRVALASITRTALEHMEKEPS